MRNGLCGANRTITNEDLTGDLYPSAAPACRFNPLPESRRYNRVICPTDHYREERLMDKAVLKELQQIKGVGEVVAQRLVEAGFDSFAKVAEAGEEGLRNIRGINPRA